MYIKLCDRCGRVTKNKSAFLLPVSHEHGRYQINGVWFGDEDITLCNNCLDDFAKFRYEHENFNKNNTLVYEHEVKERN